MAHASPCLADARTVDPPAGSLARSPSSGPTACGAPIAEDRPRWITVLGIVALVGVMLPVCLAAPREELHDAAADHEHGSPHTHPQQRDHRKPKHLR